MTATQTPNTAPLYVQFAAKIRERALELGLHFETAATETGFPQNEGYFFVRTAPNSAAMIVPKSKVRMGNVHLHVDCSDLEGHVPLPKKNGKVLGHFVADIGLLDRVMARLVGASKRPTQFARQAPVAATPSKPVEAPVEWSQFDMGEEELEASEQTVSA
jgi:hypothetical protein